jgi:putative ABC transport system substrate-binding protein
MMIQRRELIALLGGTALTWPVVVHAQQPKNSPRLCFLDFALDPGTLRSSRFDGFFQGLRSLGYVDGQTITIDYLSADGHGERFPALLPNVCASRRTSSP